MRLAELSASAAQLRAHLTERPGAYFSAAQRAAVAAEARAFLRPGGCAACGALAQACFKSDASFFAAHGTEDHHA